MTHSELLLLFAYVLAPRGTRVKTQGASAARKECTVAPSNLHRLIRNYVRWIQKNCTHRLVLNM